MQGHSGKELRRESAIERLTNTIAAHEAGVELTTKILGDKKLLNTLRKSGRKNIISHDYKKFL